MEGGNEMNKQRKVAELKCGGIWEVIHEEERKFNPYKVVHKWWEIDPKTGECKRKTKIMARYADLRSAMYLLYTVL